MTKAVPARPGMIVPEAGLTVSKLWPVVAVKFVVAEQVSCTVCEGGGPCPKYETKATRKTEVEHVGVLLITLMMIGIVRVLEPVLRPPDTKTFAVCVPAVNPVGSAEMVKLVGEVPVEPEVGLTLT